MDNIRKFTLDEIERHYKAWDNERCIRILKNGKWTHQRFTKPGLPRIDGTKAEIVPLGSVIGFVKYLKEL